MRGIGALEDVPTIVPIVIALVIFFGALSWAMERAGEVDARVNTSLKLLEIADIFVQQGVITDQSFRNSCDVAEDLVAGYGFVVYITDMDSKISTSCSGALCCKIGVAPRKNILARAFPVTYQTERKGAPFNELRKIVVVVWKEA